LFQGGALRTYNARMAGDGVELPIFELPAVILPGELLPLHIFEERYQRMIGYCLETAEPFGIVFRDDEGTAHRIGCTARVTEVLERFDDGRMNIVVTGEQPFRVLERYEGIEYPEGEVEPITAEEEPDDEDPEAADMARQAFIELVERVAGDEPGELDIATEDSYGIASRVELPVETKQALLEQRSEPQRMRMLGNALRALVAAVNRSSEIAERAKMNGKVIVG
jgi:Lon protease-like protein